MQAPSSRLVLLARRGCYVVHGRLFSSPPTGYRDVRFTELPFVDPTRSFLHCNPHLTLRYFVEQREATATSSYVGRRLKSRVHFGHGVEGPPDHVHGGCMAALMDEMMGFGAWSNGHAVVAGEITVRFEAATLITAPVACDAWIDRVEGRKVFMRAEARVDEEDGLLLGSSRGVFIEIDQSAHLERIAKRREAAARAD